MSRVRREDATAPAAPYDDDLAYLEDELAWIETRLRTLAAERRLEAGARPSRRPWTVDDEDPAPPAELRRRARAGRKAADALRATVDGRLAATRAAGRELGLDNLCKVHGLDGFERTVLLLAAAPVFSRRFEDLYDRIQAEPGHGAGLTIETIFNFAELDLRTRIARRTTFSASGALVRGDLITLDLSSRMWTPKDLLLADIELSASALSDMLGRPGLDDGFEAFSSLEEPRATFEQVVLPAEDKRRILAVVDRHDEYLQARRAWGFDDVIRYGRGALMLFHGEPGTGKTLTAHAVAHHLGRRVLCVDIPTFIDHREADRFLPALFRQARLRHAVLFFDECEAIFASRTLGNTLMTLLLTEIERFDGLAILATNLPGLLDEALERRILVKVRFPRPDIDAREAIWRQHLPASAPLAEDLDLRALAVRFDIAGGLIKNAVLAAVADAVHQSGLDGRITMACLERAAVDQARRVASDDSEVRVPSARLSDVVLPAPTLAVLDEIVRATRHRATVLDRWGVGPHVSLGRGLSALFYGPPGTGKTLCAEALAGELMRPLMFASVPALQSKWVGETEKNLSALFARARTDRAVLFLDEADSLLRARGEGRASRHDDAAVNVLLGLVERHDDLVLLATNLPAALDPALLRRLTWRVAFRAPEISARAAIWRGLLPDSVPTDGPLDFEGLARRFPIAGGYIKNAVFKAAFRAASAERGLRQEDLEAAAAEEAEGLTPDESRPIGFRRVELA